MTIEQLKAAIAAMSETEEMKTENAAAIATLQQLLDKALKAEEGDEDEDDSEDDSENEEEEEDGDEEDDDPVSSDPDDKPLTDAEQALVDRELKKMKANMNKMSAKLKEQAAAQAKREAEAKAAEITRLKENGKVQEALEMELEQVKAELSAVNETNTKLTRDNTLETVLAALDFRNSRSRAHAKRDIIDELVQEDGVWKHKSGTSIGDAVEAYANDPENKYLFKAKTNKGSGKDTNLKPANPEQKSDSLIGKTSEELLKDAASGKFAFNS